MKKILITLFLPVLFLSLQAQNADNTTGNLINQQDWFTLERELPKLENEIQTPYLKTMAKALTAFYFNKQETAIKEIDALFAFQNELGFDNINGFASIKASILFHSGRYREGVDFTQNFINQNIAEQGKEKLAAHLPLLDTYAKFADIPRPELRRPNKNVEIPIEIIKYDLKKPRTDDTVKYNTRHIFVPVKIHGKEYKFIFDTGAGTSMVSEKVAQEIGLQIINDSVQIAGLCTATGKYGVLDSFQIGEIVYKNPVFIFAPPVEELDTIIKIDAVLGIDFMKAAGEIQIFPNKNKMVFPVRQTELPDYGKNLLLDGTKPVLKVDFGNEILKFNFDTGNAGYTFLYSSYYQKHKNIFDLFCKTETVYGGGFGCIKKSEIYKIPKMSFVVGNKAFTQKNVALHLDRSGDYEGAEIGNIGMDFVELWNKITINLNKMFVKVE